MNFAYLDARSVLESVLGIPGSVHVNPTPCTLDDSWINFEAQLSDFKKEYTQTRAEYSQSMSQLQEFQEEINVVKMIIENVSSENLKSRLVDIVKDFEMNDTISTLTERCSTLAGKVEAMKKALLDTNADRYGKFTCFVCMDRLVDVFIDPCGHVICELCWTRTQNKETCPGCRTAVGDVKRIFSLS